MISINVGLPREVIWKGKTVETGIFKEPVDGRIRMRRLNLDGDRQADLSVHGGTIKAVYCYPSEHYSFWKNEFPGMDLPWGMFGENFTTRGILEGDVHIGDRFKIGSGEVKITQPRLPCFKLGIKFDRGDMIKRFLDSLRSGFYLQVTKEGEVGRGDFFEPVNRDEKQFSVEDFNRLYVTERDNLELLKQAVSVQSLPESWRMFFQNRIDKISNRPK